MQKPLHNVVRATISSTAPLGNAGNFDMVLGGFPGAVIEAEAVTSSPTVLCYVKKRADGTWRKWACYQQPVDSSTKTLRDANTTITLSAGDQIIIMAPGFYAVRLDHTGGTSADLAGSTADEIGDLIQNVGTTSGGPTSGFATEAKQDTQITNQSSGLTKMDTLLDAFGNDTSSIAVSAALPVGDEGNATVTLNGAAGLEYEVTAVSGLHVTVEAILASGGTYRQVECIQIASGYGRVRKAGADITLVSADRIFVPGDYYAVRLKRASGTSATVTTRTLGPGMVSKLLASAVELKPISNQNITAATLASAQTLTVPTGATGAWITVIEGTLGTNAGLFMTTDGATPSATEGAFVKALNQPFEMRGSDLIAAVKFIADGSTTARLSAEYFEEVYRIG